MFGNNEKYQNEKLRLQKRNLEEQSSYNKEIIRLREREIKEQELENQRVKTLEHKIIKDNEDLKKELDLYKSYFEFFKSALIDTEVFTDMYFDTNYFDDQQKLNLVYKKDHNLRMQVQITKSSFTAILMQKLGRDVMRPFEYAHQVLENFFVITNKQNVENRRVNPKYEALLGKEMD